jgi:hypothetical protein
MPLKPIDYANTIIYKLVHKEDYENTNIYIGSTTDFFRRRNNHKNCCNSNKKIGYTDKKYVYIRENGGWDEWDMLMVERYPCIDGTEARSREEYWRCLLNSNLNTKKAFITEEQRLEKCKRYYLNNKEKMKGQMKQRYLKMKAINMKTVEAAGLDI